MELRQAVLEYDHQYNCFFIEDLNTFHGTYVNECRVQNSKVKLNHGDIIRFGHGKLNFSPINFCLSSISARNNNFNGLDKISNRDCIGLKFLFLSWAMSDVRLLFWVMDLMKKTIFYLPFSLDNGTYISIIFRWAKI